MSGSPPPDGTPPPRTVLVLALVAAGLLVWYLVRAYTSPAVRECESLYAVARTAIDTAMVDSTVASAARTEKDPRTCGFVRSSARWK